ncbi:MAG TPA: hypothetical protein DD706_23625 [Nitrospiraceae bacterium]|nr:hypothetical protein [Nitrospiraceae bacterium]
MEHENSPNQWTDDQWSLVQQTVREEARKVRVARSFLPIDGPYPPETDAVPVKELNDTQPIPLPILRGEAGMRMEVDDRTTRALTSLSVNVYLRNSQNAQPDLSSAITMFRRAANIIARCEDYLVFHGQFANVNQNSFQRIPQFFTVSGGGAQWRGLLSTGRFYNAGLGIHVVRTASNRNNYLTSGNSIVTWVSQAMSVLESEGHLGPFALVLGNTLFEIAHDPTVSLVMPADRLKPMLVGGPLLRSSTLNGMEGILISLAGDPVEIVVPSDISVRFLQVTTEPRHVYRVSQRFTLRIKQPGSLCALLPPGT